MSKPLTRTAGLALLAACITLGGCNALDWQGVLNPPSSSWRAFTIDDTRSGADGVKAGDLDGDGWVDLVTAWESSGEVSVMLNPGPSLARLPWPAITVGSAPDAEDAVFLDVDRDGQLDVVSASEGSTRDIRAHLAPSNRNLLLQRSAWRTQRFAAAENAAQWMQLAVADLDGQNGPDLVAGGKNDGAAIGFLRAPANPGDLSAWQWVKLTRVAWTMSIIPVDLDLDGDIDIVYTDRKGPQRGAYWLENPLPAAPVTQPWPRHLIATADDEVMFMTLAALNNDGQHSAVIATFSRRILIATPSSGLRQPWATRVLTLSNEFGRAKAVAVGPQALYVTCEDAGGGRSGVGYFSRLGGQVSSVARTISTAGAKFDRIELLDLDADGRQDLVTTEESSGLGVLWYRSP